MKIAAYLSILNVLFFGMWCQASEANFRQEKCSASTSADPILTNGDFSWDIPLEELKLRARELYVSPKRLKNRAYVNDRGQAVIPLNVFGTVKEVPLTEKFIKSVRLHIEEALKLNYVDEIMFSDMGHSHVFIPQQYYQEILNPIPIREKHLLYEKMLAHEEVKFLYHTAEQLKMFDENKELLDDRHLQWRFFTRNLVGDNNAQGKLELLHAKDHSYNSANSYEGYKYWGAGFDLSANIDGCFPFTHEGETYYFDLNFEGVH